MNPHRLTQEDVTLSMLREAGDRGVHTFELRCQFIANPSERIARLRNAGHVIAAGPRERLRGDAFGVRYFLVVDAERLAVAA